MNHLTPEGHARALLERARPIGPSDRILELGRGAVAHVLRERLGAAATVTTAPVEAGDALPFPDGSFELVLAEPLPNPAAMLGQVHRVLVSGGRFIAGSSVDGEALRRELVATGFAEVRIDAAIGEEPGVADVVSARRR